MYLYVGVPGICLVGIAGALIYYYAKVYPWYEWPKEPPDRIEERWQLVVDLSRTPEWCGAAGEAVDYSAFVEKQKGEVPRNEIINILEALERSREAHDLALAGDPEPMRESLETARKLLRCGNLLVR